MTFQINCPTSVALIHANEDIAQLMAAIRSASNLKMTEVTTVRAERLMKVARTINVVSRKFALEISKVTSMYPMDTSYAASGYLTQLYNAENNAMALYMLIGRAIEDADIFTDQQHDDLKDISRKISIRMERMYLDLIKC